VSFVGTPKVCSFWVQLVVFDLEYGQPAATTALGTSRPPFRDILGCYGHQVAGLSNSQAGIDCLICSHQVCPYICPKRCDVQAVILMSQASQFHTIWLIL